MGVADSSLWRSVLEEWDISDSAGQAVLEEACHARDTAERLRRLIAIEGDLIAAGNGGTKLNAAIMAETAARSLVARLLGRLGVFDPDKRDGPGRPRALGRGGF